MVLSACVKTLVFTENQRRRNQCPSLVTYFSCLCPTQNGFKVYVLLEKKEVGTVSAAATVTRKKGDTFAIS